MPKEIDEAVEPSLGVRLPVVGVVQTFDFRDLDAPLDTARNERRACSFVEERVRKGHPGLMTGGEIYDYGNRQEAEILKEEGWAFPQHNRAHGKKQCSRSHPGPRE